MTAFTDPSTFPDLTGKPVAVLAPSLSEAIRAARVAGVNPAAPTTRIACRRTDLQALRGWRPSAIVTTGAIDEGLHEWAEQLEQLDGETPCLRVPLAADAPAALPEPVAVPVGKYVQPLDSPALPMVEQTEPEVSQ